MRQTEAGRFMDQCAKEEQLELIKIRVGDIEAIAEFLVEARAMVRENGDDGDIEDLQNLLRPHEEMLALQCEDLIRRVEHVTGEDSEDR